MPDGVDAGDLDVLHVAEEAAFAAGEGHLHLFVVEVDLVLEVVGGAPVSLGLEEAVAEHLREDIVVVGFGSALGISEWRGRRVFLAGMVLGRAEGGEHGTDVVALDLLEAVEELRRPGQAGDGVVGLVAAEAHDGFAELFADGLFILGVGELQILGCGRRVEVVFEGLRGVLGAGGVGVGAGGRGGEDVGDDEDGPVAGGGEPVDVVVLDRNGDVPAIGAKGGCDDDIGADCLPELAAA